MFNIGGGEMIMLAMLALLVFGPEGLPNVAKNVAKTVRALRKAGNDFRAEVRTALDEEEIQRNIENRRQRRMTARETDPDDSENKPMEPRPQELAEASSEEPVDYAESQHPALEQPKENVESSDSPEPVDSEGPTSEPADPAETPTDEPIEGPEDQTEEPEEDDDYDGPAMPMNTIKRPSVETTS